VEASDNESEVSDHESNAGASDRSHSSDEPPAPPELDLDEVEERIRDLLSAHTKLVEDKLDESIQRSMMVSTIIDIYLQTEM
jgi:hypothetical protein